MTAIDYEAEYNNSRRVPEFPQISARWQAASDAYRSEARAELDQPYGPGPRHRYDLYRADDTAARAGSQPGSRRPPGPPATVLYIHGGYWQEGDRTVYAFLAEALNAAGVTVVIPSYSLAPAVGVIDIVDELRQCLAAVWQATEVRPLVVGHSAGGHLTGAMLATDWSKVEGVPGDLVRAGVAISGLFDLRPLVTTTINAALGLNRESALEASPRFWPTPTYAGTLVTVVGGDESAEFHRQSLEMTDHWRASGLPSEYLEVPGTNHFTVIEELTSPTTDLFKRVAELARACAVRSPVG